MKNPQSVNKLIIHPNFKKTIIFLKNEKIKLPPPTNEEPNFNQYPFPQTGKLIAIEKIGVYSLNAKNGEAIAHKKNKILAYDESSLKFSALEGIGYFTSHSLIIHGNHDYIPSNYLTFYFYTRSKILSSKYDFIKDVNSSNDGQTINDDSTGAEVEYKRNYAEDRMQLMCDNTPNDSILFIDGPLIGGQINDQTIKLNEFLISNDIIPIFFVKNSSSNLVTDNLDSLKGKYHSDMHWAYNLLKAGSRTNFFQYVDENNPKFAKIFCYLKAINVSPQRIEFHKSLLEKYTIDEINDLMDLIYYLILVQGSLTNPQIRSIAIAEMFARETLKLYDINYILNTSGLIPTMNQVRFG